MKLLVVSDEQGKIVSILTQADIGPQPSGIVEVGASPEQGQQVCHLELPPKLRKESLVTLHTRFRLKFKGDKPYLVRLRDQPPQAKRKR